jgi:DnaK suppressor protein
MRASKSAAGPAPLPSPAMRSAPSDDTRRATTLTAARERVVRRSAELQAAFDAIVDASSDANLDDEHDPEGPTVGFERAQVSALLERARSQVAELDAALDRLQRGSYGACEQCGASIPEARLEAQPAARRCVACAAR